MKSFLSPEELHELTDSPLRSLQIAWLEQNRWVFTTSRLGNPKVLRSYAEKKLGLADDAAQGQTEPDFSTWN